MSFNKVQLQKVKLSFKKKNSSHFLTDLHMNYSTSTVKGLDKAKIMKMPCRATHLQTNLANAPDGEMRNVLVPSTFMLY